MPNWETVPLLLITALAVWELLEIWRHGELFAWLRAILDLYTGWWARLLSCMFCLAPWLSGLLLLAMWPDNLLGAASRFVVLALAVARLANLANDLTYDVCRTPKGDRLEAVTEPEQGDCLPGERDL